MSTLKWTVTTHEKRKENKAAPVSSPTRFESEFTSWLRYEGRKVHSLTGKNGQSILEAAAADYNARNYEPKLEDGKIYLELSQSQRDKLAQKFSPTLPFEEDPS